MSASAAGFSDTRAARFWTATIGKKVVMAVSGAILFLFVVGHLLGNLQVFMGAEQFNDYAEFLRVEPALLWTVRMVLLIMVLLHIWASIQLAVLNKLEARPVGYVKKKEDRILLCLPDDVLERPDHRGVRHLPSDAIHLGRGRHAFRRRQRI